MPPQSMSLSLWSRKPSVQLAMPQAPFWHEPLLHSSLLVQVMPMPQPAPQVGPQSTATSSKFCSPSRQVSTATGGSVLYSGNEHAPTQVPPARSSSADRTLIPASQRNGAQHDPLKQTSRFVMCAVLALRVTTPHSIASRV